MVAGRVFSIGAVILVLSFAGGAAVAAGAGTVVHVSGTLSVLRADGSVLILSQKSEVNPGDTLATQRDSYAQINFTDGSALTMRPNTQLKLEAYHFVHDSPQEDRTFLRLIKGGLRTVTGLVGRRGNQDAYKIGTITATIGIRGSSGDTLACTPDCAGVTSTSGRAPPGVYHTTYRDTYTMTTDAGEILIRAGEFGFAADPKLLPVILPVDPGLNLQQMPFVLGVGGGPNLGGFSQECAVR